MQMHGNTCSCARCSARRNVLPAATHLHYGRWPVAVEGDPDTSYAVNITYVGPEVPENRHIGEVRLATTVDIFSGRPSLQRINTRK